MILVNKKNLESTLIAIKSARRSLSELSLLYKTAADYAGRPLPDDLSLPQFLINPYQQTQPNYSGGEVLKQKQLEREESKKTQTQRLTRDEEKKEFKQQNKKDSTKE